VFTVLLFIWATLRCYNGNFLLLQTTAHTFGLNRNKIDKIRGSGKINKTVVFAFKKTIPIIFGYLFLGIGFGIMLQEAGYNALWALFGSFFIYAGSMQYFMVHLLITGAPLLTVALMTLLINSRHIFYGLGFIDQYRRMGWKYPYMVLSLTDETYVLLSTCKYPEGVDRDKAAFLISMFNHCWWITGSVLGVLIGTLIPFDLTGIDFCMTALFVILLINHIRQVKAITPVIIGFVSAILFLLIMGPDNFILPSLCFTVLALTFLKGRIESGKEGTAL
jgi:4-azaleucine resistance transporter AzlC